MLILPLALLLGVGACAASDVPQDVDTTWVTSTDAELARAASELLPDLAAKAGLSLSHPVRVEWRTKEELEGYLRAKVDEELPAEEAQALSDAYARLGLFPEPVDLRALLLDVHLEQVAGFYDPDSTALFVMEGQDEGLLRTILVHELVHAIQDQTTSLDSITAKERGSDAQTAAQSAIEGHATLVMLEFMAEQMQGVEVDLSAMPDFASRIGPMLEQARNQYPALAKAPRVIQESLLYPYLAGAGFVQALWFERGARPAPFGEDLPQSTEQIEDPERFTTAPRDEPTRVTLEAGGAIRHRDTLGQLGTRILLEETIGGEAGALSRGWDGDEYVLWTGEEASSHPLAWVTVWDDDAARDAFAEALSANGRAVESLDQEGRPLAIVRFGAVPDFTVELVGGA